MNKDFIKFFVLLIVYYILKRAPHYNKLDIDGKYTGDWKLSNTGRRFAAFQGIRYAQPPVGELRFKDPVVLNDNNDYQVNEVPECLQMKNNTPIGTEDCLFLNIYTHLDKKRPVMVWIHGGAYMSGSSKYSIYGPQALMDHDIVLVTINYRLGIFGFASLENDEMVGNYGLKDQLMAIEWIIKNINAFGGDPNKITLAGQSAGASSALIHLRGKLSGIITKCIALSGSVYSPWSMANKGDVKKVTAKIGYAVNCTENIAACMRQIDGYELLKKGMKALNVFEKYGLPFRPVVDGNIIKNDPWKQKLNSAPFSLMMGFTKNEASFIIDVLNKNDISLDLVFDYFLPELLMTDRFQGKFQDKIENFYTKNGSKKLNEAMTDAWFLYPGVVEAQNHKGELYSFIFNYTSNLPYWAVDAARNQTGPVHCDELPFIFVSKKYTLNKKQLQISDLMTKMIVKYVHGIEPTYNNYLVDANQGFKNVDNFKNIDFELYARLKFWTSLKFENTNNI